MEPRTRRGTGSLNRRWSAGPLARIARNHRALRAVGSRFGHPAPHRVDDDSGFPFDSLPVPMLLVKRNISGSVES